MSFNKDDLEKYLSILKAFDKAIEEGPWEQSVFYKAIGKKLRDLRQDFIDQFNLTELTQKGEEKKSETEILPPPSGYTDIYVSLYLADGSNLQKWQILLSTITGTAVNRPIYKTEREVRTAIRSRPNKICEGYAAVRVKEDDFLTSEKPPVDRFGAELLVLKENTVLVENIIKFVHISGEYKWLKGKLIRIGNVDFVERHQ